MTTAPTLPNVLRAQRLTHLSMLAGIYRMPGHYPEVEKFAQAHPAVLAKLQPYYDAGKLKRQEIGLRDAEQIHAVIPYQLWTAI